MSKTLSESVVETDTVPDIRVNEASIRAWTRTKSKFSRYQTDVDIDILCKTGHIHGKMVSKITVIAKWPLF